MIISLEHKGKPDDCTSKMLEAEKKVHTHQSDFVCFNETALFMFNKLSLQESWSLKKRISDMEEQLKVIFIHFISVLIFLPWVLLSTHKLCECLWDIVLMTVLAGITCHHSVVGFGSCEYINTTAIVNNNGSLSNDNSLLCAAQEDSNKSFLFSVNELP